MWVRIVVGCLMAGAGALHFFVPRWYGAVLPRWYGAVLPRWYGAVLPRWYGAVLPPWFPLKREAILWSGVVEVLVGVALLYSPTARWGALGLLVLMAAFLPLHLYHLWEPPGRLAFPYGVYVGRAFLQVVVVWGCWRLWQSL